MLVDRCYDKPDELAAKEFLLKDLFMRGLRDERVSIAVLTECDSLDFQDLVKLAQKHELAVEAFTLSKKKQQRGKKWCPYYQSRKIRRSHCLRMETRTLRDATGVGQLITL